MKAHFSTADILAALAEMARRKVRVQCVTNTVAQAITANVLLAVGADASMAVHPREIVAMSESAGALLINLGTLDTQREQAIAALLPVLPDLEMPVVLDPVFVQASPIRHALALSLLETRTLIIRGSAREMAVLPRGKNDNHTYVTTGAIDKIEGKGGAMQVRRGHPWMAKVTGTGCAAGALIGAFAAVVPNPARAAAMALTAYGAAAEHAAKKSSGPGSFAVNFIDALSMVDETMLMETE